MIIAPSLLAANFTRLGTETVRASRSGAEWLHLDIMDGHFVPNISFGPAVVKAVRPLSKLIFDVHLMCARPEILFEPFASAGANRMTVHVEVGQSVRDFIWKIRSLGKQVGLAINPPTAMKLVEPFLDQIDSLLVMTVHPGFGGQSFITETLPKIQQAAAWRRERGLNFRIGVDGGVEFHTVADCAKAGADTFISGTGIFAHKNLRAAVAKMRKLADAAAPENLERAASEHRLSDPMSIKFGTDGWRAVIAEDFTFQNVERVSQATADYWNASPPPETTKKIIIGYDRRFLSDLFARRTAEVMGANGFEVILTNCPTPTPSVSLAVKQQQACGGIMITASHNPAIFNGFKLKAHYGGSADSAICHEVEKFIDQNPVRVLKPEDAARQIKITDLRPAHFQAIKRMVDFKLIAKSKLRFAHDALFGVGAGCFETLLAGTTCRVTTLNGAHDPNFGGINPEPISQNYAASSAYLKKHPHDICLVTDGDADRVGGMDGHGNPLTTHQIICLILHHLIANRKAAGRVIKALTTTSMVDAICARYGIELVETPVGFKYICAEMLKPGVLLGFEESGGIGFPQLMPERDGIASGMMLLELLATERKSVNTLLSRLEKQFGPHSYARLDTHFPLEKRAALMDFCKNSPPPKLLSSPIAEIKSYDGVKFIAKNGSWLMLRGSGTEPILRIYAEGKSASDAQKLLRQGQSLTKQI